MEFINPYAPPETQEPRRSLADWEMRLSAWHHLAIAIALLPVWFLIGGAISIGGSETEILIDSLGFLALFGYGGIALLVGILRSILR